MNFFIKLALVICIAYQAECHNKSHHLSKRQIASSVCSSNTCKYGTCEIISQISYKCHCQYGITGTNCDQQAPSNSPCSSNPCYGEGTCINLSATQFQCLCPSGYGGTQCKGTTGTCSCQNGGTCVATASGTGILAYECNCPANFGGNLCQFVKSTFQSCQNVGCQNGGYCTIFSTCLCPNGFTGTFCELSNINTVVPATTTATPVTTSLAPVTQTPYPLNICAPGICLNGGQCYQITSALALCLCTAGYSGVYCNIAPTYYTTASPVTLAPVTVTVAPINSCATNPCLNGGLCVASPTSSTSLVPNTGYRCICAAAFTGTNCETGYSCTNYNCPVGQRCSIGSNFLPQCIPIAFQG